MITAFTPWSSLIGGLLIGASAVMLMLLYGRIAGVSGILGRILPPVAMGDVPSSAAFLVGLVAAPLVYQAATGVKVIQTVVGSPLVMIVAGLAVGFGVVWGNGCTSGHGVCGIARLSRRSMVATLVFMVAAGLTVFVVRHGMGG